MDEMTALEFLKCKDRICRTYACNVCPIWRSRPDQSEGAAFSLQCEGAGERVEKEKEEEEK